MSEKNPIRICFYMTGSYQVFINATSGFGGAEINMYYIARELAKYPEYEIEFFVGDFGQEDEEIRENVKLIKIKYLNPARFDGMIHKFLCRFYFFQASLKSKSDLYITSTAGEFLGYLIFIVCFLKKKKTIFRIGHDWDVDGTIFNRKNHVGLLYRYALKRFDRIIAQNEYQCQILYKKHGLKSTIIKNGFPIQYANKNHVHKHLLWVGRSVDFKRPHLFLKLAKKVPEENFLMILTGISELKNEIVELAAEIDNLKIIDEVRFQEVHMYFAKAKCYINTSTTEGFPNTFIQSGLNQIPILSFRVDPDNIIERFQLGYMCDDDIEKGINFLKELDENKIRVFGKNGLEYVMKNHDLSEKVTQYKILINKMYSES